VPVNRRGPGFVDQPPERGPRVAAREHEARAECREVERERSERVVQPPARGPAGGPRAFGLVVEDVDGNDGASRARRAFKPGGEGGVVLEAEVLAEPEDDAFHGFPNEWQERA